MVDYKIDTWAEILEDCTTRLLPKPSIPRAKLSMMNAKFLVQQVVMGKRGTRYKFVAKEKYCYSGMCFYTNETIECEQAMCITITDLTFPNDNVMERWFTKNAFGVLALGV